jgi:alkanesulfonate monooxygenase SsuD/methylene tetrahydromethanopterin reductase-like flavin-dependent oxidoreductase (luciferase family)
LRDGARWHRAILPGGQPPVYIAAIGPKAVSLAGKVADGILFNELATPEAVHWVTDRASASAREHGRDPDDLAFYVNPALMVTDDPEPVLERKKAFMVMVHALPGMERLLMTEAWDVPAIIAGVREAMRTEEIVRSGGLFAELREAGDLDRARSLIPTGLVDAAAAIGPLDHVRNRLAEYAAAGATHCFVDRRGLPGDAGEVSESLANVVAP